MVVPVLVALVVLANVLGGGSDAGDDERAGHGGPAEVEGTLGSGRDDLPILEVDVPAVTPQADASCPALMGTLPLELTGEPSRRADSDSPFAYAWGDPAMLLICGVDRPEGLRTGTATIQINGAQW